MQKCDAWAAAPKTGRGHPTWVLNPSPDMGMPRITILRTLDAVFHVYAECSLPRILYGHNARLPSSEADVLRGVELICENTEARLSLPFDARTAVITKIHLTRDYQVGDAANRAVFALFDKRLRHFPKRNITAADGHANTLYFNYASTRRNCVICVYPKHAEVLAKKGSLAALDAAKGILRIEYRANTRSGVKSLCSRHQLEDERELLTLNINDRIFRKLESELHFPECINDRESTLTKLLAIYSVAKAQRLFGFLELRRLKGDAELTKSDRERRNFNVARRDCERAGVWLDLRRE